MNKTTLPLFISGVLVGFGLCLMFIKKDPAPKPYQISTAPVMTSKIEKVPTPETSSRSETKPAPVAAPLLEPEPVAIARPIPHEAAQTSRIDMDISDDDVTAIEESMPELREDVRLIQDERGWLVRFYKPDNALASIGVQDNDLIRFEQFDDMKRDPNKEKLVGRLETLLKELAQ